MHTARKRMRGLIAASALVPLLALAGCAANTAKTAAHPAPTDGVLTVGLLGDIGQPPDPDIYYANNGTALIINTYEGLVQYKNNVSDVQIAPRLATSWTVSPDKTVYTFKLRSGVTFHDGTPFTSAAVKVAFDRRIAVKGGAAYMVSGVKSVDTPDDLTAVVTLDAPNSAFLDELASPFGPKMESPTGLAKNAGSDDAQTYLQTHDLGTGPYELTGAQVGTKYELTQYDKYWGTKSPFTKIELPVFTDASALELAFDKGDVSMIAAALPSSALKKYANSSFADNYFLPTLQSALITVNPSKSFFKDVDARMAFMSAIDKKKLVSQVLGSRSSVATTMYAKGMIKGGADKQTIPYDPSIMKKYASSASDKNLVIGYATGNPNAEQIANILAAQLIADGLKATAQSYTTSTVFGWENDPTKGPDAFIDGNNGPDGGSPYLWGHVFWDASGGINYFLCNDDKTNSLLNEALATGSEDTYIAAAKQYESTGCYMNLSYNKDWVVSQKWLTGVPESQNLGANELNFALLGIKK
ncbi:MAG: extracellular solute-binding protein family 5 [Microbacteriaceae bacterium]|nr:extracellular solute-binding protein family 5 [Microbacteriaceae bacterium]